MHLVLVGPTCSGKTTLAEYLVKLGFRRIITYTTRPRRNHEVDASTLGPIELKYADPPADYFFVDMDEFKRAEYRGYFAETTGYEATWGYCRYGSAKDDWLGSEDTVCVLNPDGVRQLRSRGYDIFVVYLNTPMVDCMDRARKRGDDEMEIARRCAHDLEDFHKFENEVVKRTADLDENGKVIKDSYKETHLYDISISGIGDLKDISESILGGEYQANNSREKQLS